MPKIMRERFWGKLNKSKQKLTKQKRKLMSSKYQIVYILIQEEVGKRVALIVAARHLL